MENSIKVLLFDVMPYVYSAYFTGMTMSNIGSGKEITPVFVSKVLNNAKQIIVQKLETPFKMISTEYFIPIFCYDGHAKRKKEALAEYKKTREASKSTMNFTIINALINEVQKFPGWHCKNKEEEADDLIATMKVKINSQLQERNLPFQNYILTKDNDLLQLCDPNTVLVDILNFAVRDKEYLKSKFLLDKFSHIILYKILFGDESDNIRGIFSGKRKKRASIVEKFKNFKDMVDFLDSDIFEGDESLKEMAIKLYDIIRLRDDLTYESFFNESSHLIKVNMFKDIKI